MDGGYCFHPCLFVTCENFRKYVGLSVCPNVCYLAKHRAFCKICFLVEMFVYLFIYLYIYIFFCYNFFKFQLAL